ncbi:Gfo/Idh/MocA family oxidoreductase [Acidovorax sp. D2M1]|uniref:Gfo/Idh/MocA family oxidoreductase n=1 Tax=Acidovorax benzenivorans TaxID=2987520 RepID=A0ABT5RU05_9BURK|nr:Gfo/Idh/MocA family oxidoreductase [Acidovorax benzenivorans]MDD2177164.1 Gfo/Idh/MocA family oxidoreductase [Acidovorax benzenivorans]
MSIRILVTGRGSIALRHVRCLRDELPGLELAVLSSTGEVDADFQPCSVFTTLSHGLQWNPDAVVIASVSSRHGAELRACLKRGLHCLVEKPLVVTRAELDDLRAALSTNEQRSAIVVGCNLRYLPVVRQLAAALADVRIGAVVRAHLEVGQNLTQWRPNRELVHSYSAQPELGGGVVFDLVHEIDMARWLLGPLQVQAAVGGRLGHLPIKSDDVHVALLTRFNGAPVVISLDYLSQQAVRRYAIVCEGGSLTCDVVAKRLTFADGSETRLIADMPADFDVAQSYRTQMKDWLAAWHDSSHAVASSLADALESAELMLAMNEALT